MFKLFLVLVLAFPYQATRAEGSAVEETAAVTVQESAGVTIQGASETASQSITPQMLVATAVVATVVIAVAITVYAWKAHQTRAQYRLAAESARERLALKDPSPISNGSKALKQAAEVQRRALQQVWDARANYSETELAAMIIAQSQQLETK